MCLYSILCPDGPVTGQMTMWMIMSKVRVEAFMWVSKPDSYWMSMTDLEQGSM